MRSRSKTLLIDILKWQRFENDKLLKALMLLFIYIKIKLNT